MIRPLGEFVLLKRVEAASMSAGGLHIPENAREKTQMAVVVAVGGGRRTAEGRVIEPRVKVGDRVVMPKYAGTEITWDGAEHVFLAEEQILAVDDEERK